MFEDNRFWRATRRANAVQIWLATAAGIFMGLVGLLEGLGIAISMLLAVLVLPLALLTIIIIQQRTALVTHIRAFLSTPPGPNDSATAHQVNAPVDPTTAAERERLEHFIIDHLQAACLKQVSLQKAILRVLCNNEDVLGFAERGLVSAERHSDFARCHDTVRGFGGSPMPHLQVDELIRLISRLEHNTYWDFCQQAQQLADMADIDHRRHPETAREWEEWRRAHNALVEAYDKLKRESRYPKLYRPQLPSRWGGLIPPTAPLPESR